MEDKLDKIIEKLNVIEVHQAEIKVDLKHHVRRTDELQAIVTQVRDIDLPPIKNHVRMMAMVGSGLVLGGKWLVGMITVMGALWKLFHR